MIECMFTCHACGLEKIKFRVRDRFANEDVIAFMTECRRIAHDVHGLRQPGCPSRTVDLYMPFNKETGRVGETPPAGKG